MLLQKSAGSTLSAAAEFQKTNRVGLAARPLWAATTHWHRRLTQPTQRDATQRAG
jgi:hypothetical protein